MLAKYCNSLELSLRNWGRAMCIDMIVHGINPQPAAPITSKDYRAPNPGLPDPDPYVPPDKQWAEEVQQAIVRMNPVDATMLAKRYRDGWTVPRWLLNKAKYRLWRMM